MDVRHGEMLAKAWIQGWRQRDAEAVLALYADDVEFQSPLVVKLRAKPSGTVHGTAELREYFQRVLTAIPVISIDLVGVYQGVDCLLVQFQANGKKSVEVMELNQEGKIRRAITLGQLVAPSNNGSQGDAPQAARA